MPKKLTKQEILETHLKDNVNKKDAEIAGAVKKAYPDLFKDVQTETIRKQIGALRREHNLIPVAEKKILTVEESIEEDRLIQSLKQSNSDIDKKYKFVLGELEKVNKQFETVLNVKNSKLENYIIPFKVKDKSQSIAFANASDWHLGEVVEPFTVNELNIFNKTIGKQRADKFFQSVARLIEIERYGTDIDTLVLGLLGDLMTGYIHEELEENSDLSPTETIIFLRSIITSGINFLKKECNLKKIIIPTAIGNHGRTTPKRRHATAYKNSYEWLLYKILEADYIKDEVVSFRVSEGYHNWLNIYNKYDIRFHHGDNVNYNGGVGGITIPVNKAIAQWNKIKTATLDVFGHFHQYFYGGNFLVNGSIIGYNSYALSIKASYEEPKQSFFVIEKDRGITAVRPVFVTEK